MYLTPSKNLAFAGFCFIGATMKLQSLIFLVGCIIGLELKADNTSPYDQLLLDQRIVDDQFNIVDHDAHIELFRVINNAMAKSLPRQADSATTYTMIRISSTGLTVSLEFKGIDSVEDLENSLNEDLFRRAMKNRVCQIPLINSNLFRKTTKGNVIYEINSFDLKLLKNYTMSYRDCDIKAS